MTKCTQNAEIRGCTENRRIEKARTPMSNRMKNERTFPNACRTVFVCGFSGAAIDGRDSHSACFSTKIENSANNETHSESENETEGGFGFCRLLQ